MKIPLLLQPVSAGFPSPADDFIDKKLDLNELLIKHPEATYFARVKGDSMKNAGIHPDDILIIDKSLSIKNGSIVVAALDGEFTLKRIKKLNESFYLVPENNNYKPIKVNEDDDFQIFGVVKNVIKFV